MITLLRAASLAAIMYTHGPSAGNAPRTLTPPSAASVSVAAPIARLGAADLLSVRKSDANCDAQWNAVHIGDRNVY